MRIRLVYRIVEFSILVRSGVQLDDIWLYVWDSAPTFIGVMAFAIVLPYELPYGGMFKGILRHRRCPRNDYADESRIICEPKVTREEMEDESENP